MDVHLLDPHDEVRASAWYRAMRSGSGHGRVAPLVTVERVMLTSLRTNDVNVNCDRRAYGVWDGTDCLGTALLELPRHTNTRIAELEVATVPSHRGHGIGAALFDHVVAVAAAEGRTVLSTEIDVPTGAELVDQPGGRFAARRGFTTKHTEQHLVLDLPVPAQRLFALDASAAGRSAGYRTVSWTGPCPARWLAHRARMQTQMQRDAPSGAVARVPVAVDADQVRAAEERLVSLGYQQVTTLVLDSAGEPAGYTLLLVIDDDVIQDDTFVARAHRGHRLGTVLKAANLRALAEQHPTTRHVHTWNAHVNDAMQSINKQVGFRVVENTHVVEREIR